MLTGCIRDLGLKEEYRTGRDDLVRDFFVPCLSVARKYDRAVGYFTSAGLKVASAGFDAFTLNGARGRLVASPNLTAEDVDAITRGLVARESVVEMRLLEAIASIPGEDDSVALLAWLVASGTLDVRIALPNQGTGIFHEKVGVIQDFDGCQIAFAGSANETVGGLVANFESIDVFFSWDASSARVLQKRSNFDELWSGNTNGLTVVDLPEAVRQQLIHVSSGRRPGRRIAERNDFGPPYGFATRGYQTDAVDAWVGNGYRGILSMATGSGKTKTALAAATRLFDGLPGAPRLVILVPYIHLVDQWALECEAWGLRPIRCYESSGSWEPEVRDAIDMSAVLVERPVVMISTLRTARLSAFGRALDSLLERPTLLVADEVHHLGSEDNSKILDHRYQWRLGLSATPARWSDEFGTELLESYFEGVVFEFTIAQAIAANCLVPYQYEPILVDLDGDELDRYRSLMGRIEAIAGSPDAKQRDKLLRLLDERSHLLDTASGKIAALRTEVQGRVIAHTLLYCASRDQLAFVSDLLRGQGIYPRPFTSEESRTERMSLLREFANGRVPAIVAIRALDEGVDVPNIREAHLLKSSANPREFIQRRGRILRPAPGKARARLVDYVVVPVGYGDYERELARREMSRVLEFGSSSINPDDVRERVWPILNGYGLMHLIARGLR